MRAAIVREQRLLRRERLLNNPGLIIGAVRLSGSSCCWPLLIIPAVSSVDPNAMEVTQRLKPPSAQHGSSAQMNLAATCLSGCSMAPASSLVVGGAVAVFSCLAGHHHRGICQLLQSDWTTF